ncbi:MAG: ABC transporter permease, partial [Dehalococcoidia bacterium]
MAPTVLAAEAELTATARNARSTGDLVARLRRLRRHRGAVAGLIVIGLLVFVTVLAPLIAPYDPLEAAPDLRFQAPSSAHLFGTDELGRDTLSRIMYGGRVSLLIGIIPVMIAAITGVVLGMTAGYFGGLVDMLIMRCIDVMMAFPGIPLALAVIAVLGVSLRNLMISVGIFSIPLYTRVLRGSTLSAREYLYVEAARSIGCGHVRLLARHILP